MRARFFLFICGMYILVADSGSTKTDWVLLHNGKEIARTLTIGFNPYFHSVEQISSELRGSLLPQIAGYADKISGVHYYGAGCSTTEKCDLVRQGIIQVIQQAKIHVSHDLLASARALCGHEWGIAAILGTGSNSCLYDGEKVIENVPSVGYLWSDYGGGSQIGKLFIRDYFEGRLPKHLCADFEKEGYNRETILDNVYKGGMPSRYLAAVSLFIGKHLAEESVQRVLHECFDSFFVYQISKYTDSKKYKINSVGSVGFYYRDIVASVAKKHGYSMGTVIRSPMDGLVAFHSK